MPKGHYERKPRAPEPEIKPAEADAELAAEPFSVTDYERTMSARMSQMIANATEENAKAEAEDDLARAHAAGSQWSFSDETRDRLSENFSAPVAEPITLAVPPHDMVNFKVGMWAGSFCRGEHQVTWLPADDGASLEVTLITAHGTSTLKAPAGNWTEADVDAALAQMRSDLRV